MNKRVSRILWGVIWIAFGILLAGHALHLWNVKGLIENGWWTLFIIVPCIISILCNGFNILPTIFLAIAVMILLQYQGIIIRPGIRNLIIPVILIIVGLNIVIKGLLNPGNQIKTAPEKEMCYAAVFSGRKIKYPKVKYSGSELNAIFGGLTLDLKEAVIEEDVNIDCSAVFGGIDLLLPENVKVKNYSNAVFGGVEDKRRITGDTTGPTVYLSGLAMFGGVTVR